MRILAFLCLALVGCERVASSLPARSRRAVPRVSATVLSYRTTILPKKQGVLHRVMIADQKGRLGDEVDQWRLFDFAERTVTFVDDVAKTYRTEPIASLMRTRRALVARPLPLGVPAAQLFVPGVTRRFGAFEAEQFLIRAGSYQREIWLSTEGIAPVDFFAMMLSTDAISEPNAAMLRAVYPRLVREKGFPVLDRTDLPFDGEAYVVEKKLEKIETISVPAEWFEIPRGYTNEGVTGSAAGRRPASSLPPDRKTPAME
ncbi:MAG TPA: hypothetical protein VIL97_01640 [Thermoanaerobaculia bacterium]